MFVLGILGILGGLGFGVLFVFKVWGFFYTTMHHISETKFKVSAKYVLIRTCKPNSQQTTNSNKAHSLTLHFVLFL